MDQRIGRQGGWVGLIGLLLALAIVAWLARDALRAYGLLPSAAGTKSTRSVEKAQEATGMVGGAVDLASPPASQSPIDRARGVQDTVNRQAEQAARRADGVR